MNFTVMAHCDWGLDAKKRWMSMAKLKHGVWSIEAPELVGDSARLLPRLAAHGEGVGSILIGFDFPIGLPRWYAERAGFGSFRKALSAIGASEWERWFDVAEHHSEISVHRPFYPMRPGGTRRLHQLEALGAPEGHVLLRECERATADRQAACSLFWTLGGNQVGKGAISGWREIIIPNLATAGLWPFDGDLEGLSSRYPVVLAETYPGDVYRQLGIPRGSWSKRRQEDRHRVGQFIAEWLASRPNLDASKVSPQLNDGFGSDSAGEDRFDAFVGLLGMLAVMTGEREERSQVAEEVMAQEGWILGHHR
jgi:hypothetical protein